MQEELTVGEESVAQTESGSSSTSYLCDGAAKVSKLSDRLLPAHSLPDVWCSIHTVVHKLFLQNELRGMLDKVQPFTFNKWHRWQWSCLSPALWFNKPLSNMGLLVWRVRLPFSIVLSFFFYYYYFWTVGLWENESLSQHASGRVHPGLHPGHLATLSEFILSTITTIFHMG